MTVKWSNFFKKTTLASMIFLASNSAFADQNTAIAPSENPYLTYLIEAQNAFKTNVVQTFQNYLTLTAPNLNQFDINASLENPIILENGDVSFSLVYDIRDDMQIVTIYQVKPESKRENGVQTIAAYSAVISDVIGNSDSDEISNLLNTLQFKTEGFLTADGNLIEVTKNVNAYQKNGINLPNITVKTQTTNNMALTSVNYQIPQFSAQKDDKSQLNIKQFVADYQQKPTDNLLFSLLGVSAVHLDELTFKDRDQSAQISQFDYKTEGKLNTQGLVDTAGSLSFKGKAQQDNQKHTFELETQFGLTNIDNDAYAQYLESKLERGLLASYDSLESALLLIKSGAGLSFSDMKFTLDDKTATGNFLLNLKPTAVSNLQNPAQMMKVLSNIEFNADFAIPNEILSTLLKVDSQTLTQMIAQSQSQLRALGLEDALTTKNNIVKINIGLKQGIIYINNQQKMPLVNLFMGALSFYF